MQEGRARRIVIRTKENPAPMQNATMLSMLGNVTGYPGVFQGNPHPYLCPWVWVFTGMGRGFTKT